MPVFLDTTTEDGVFPASQMKGGTWAIILRDRGMQDVMGHIIYRHQAIMSTNYILDMTEPTKYWCSGDDIFVRYLTDEEKKNLEIT